MFYFQDIVNNNKEALEVLLQHGASMKESDLRHPLTNQTTQTFVWREYEKQKEVILKIITNDTKYL